MMSRSFSQLRVGYLSMSSSNPIPVTNWPGKFPVMSPIPGREDINDFPEQDFEDHSSNVPQPLPPSL